MESETAPLNRSDVQSWLDRYVEAWRTNDAEQVRSLFTDDATYQYRPWPHPEHTLKGVQAIVENWLEEPDEPGSWEAQYEPFVVEEDRAVAIGYSRYFASGDDPERTYHNCYLLRFAADGRCREFIEYYMLEDQG